MAQFIVVYFHGDKGVVSVPSNWVKEIGGDSFCFWPKKKPTCPMSSLIKKRVPPNTATWSLLKVEKKFHCNDYKEAREKAKELSEQLTSHNENSDDDEETLVDNNVSTDGSSDDVTPVPKRRRMALESIEAVGETSTARIENVLSNVVEAVSKLDSKLEALQCQNKIMHEETFKEVVNTKEEVKSIKRSLAKSNTPILNSNLPPLPVKTKEDLDNLEELIKEESEAANLVSRLSNYAGSALRSTINNIMKNTMTAQVGLLYSMQGKTNKLSFLETRVCRCIQGE